MPDITVAVTGLNAIDSPGPGVGVIRAIREWQDFTPRIIGLSYDSLEPGIYMHDLVDKSYQIPYPSAGSNQVMERIAYIHEKEKIDLIIPNFDSELKSFIKLSPRLAEMGIHTFLPSLQELEAIDKAHLYEFGRKHGFVVPKTLSISSVHEIPGLREEMDFPMVVKGKYYEAYIATDEAMVNFYFHKLNAKWGLPVLVQEFVTGTEIDIAGLGDGRQLIGAVPMRKLYITDKGKGWAGVTLGDDRLIELARKFVEAASWKGGFELEYMRGEDETFYLMEVNPRFPAWIYTTAAAGQNLPGALVSLAMGKKVKPFDSYKVGTLFVRYSWDLITHIKEFEQISTLGEL